MKRVLLTAFLALFVASIIGRSVERTVVWAQHAHDFARSTPDRAGAKMGEARKHTSWQVQTTKSIEDGSLMAAVEKSAEPPMLETALHHLSKIFIEDPNNRALSSRAPPSFI
jgi:hypothetical protein